MGKKSNNTFFVCITNWSKEEITYLWANEERIKESIHIRVIEIGGHNVAACAMEHADNLNECDFFLLTRVSKSVSNNYEINFAVWEKTKEIATTLSFKLLNIYNERGGANFKIIENIIRKLK